MKTAIVVVAMALAGCATGYHPAGRTGGFSELRLNDRAYEVSFSGNGYTNSERARRFALRRAADLTLQAHFSHFVVDGQGADTNVSFSSVNGEAQVVSRPSATVRFHMLTAEEAGASPPGAVYDAATILAQFHDDPPPATTGQQSAAQGLVRR